MKAFDHDFVVEKVVERDEKHPLVVRHVRAHDRVGPGFVLRGAARMRVRAGRMHVDRLEQSVRAEHAHRLEPRHILHDRARPERHGQHRRVRRDDEILLELPLEAEPRNAEGAILVRLVRVEPRIRRLGNAPRRLVLLPIGNLRFDRELGALLRAAFPRDCASGGWA